jgi:hypothetical protein
MEKIRKKNKSGPKKGKTEIGIGKKIRKREREHTLFIMCNPYSHVGFCRNVYLLGQYPPYW